MEASRSRRRNWGARIMGAGFGGYVLALFARGGRLEETYWPGWNATIIGGRCEQRLEFPEYLMRVEAGEGALRPLDS